MNKLLTMIGLIAVLTLGCDSAPPVSDADPSKAQVEKTTLASILPENKATAIYGVTGMT